MTLRRITDFQTRARARLLPSPRSYCLPHNKPTNQQMSCWGKEQQLYSGSQQIRKMVDQCPKDTRTQASSTVRGEGVWLVVTNFLVLARPGEDELIFCSYQLSTQVQLCWSNRTDVILCSITFYLYSSEKFYIIQGQAWKAEPREWAVLIISGYSHILLQKVQRQLD